LRFEIPPWGKGGLFDNQALWNESKSQGLAKELGDISDPKTSHQIETVNFHRSDTNIESFTDFSIGETLCDKPKNFFLTGCERLSLIIPNRRTHF
jgi:hypothetical protein